ncbi:MAG: glycoside hydrolase family 28 protein [Prevotellaceae bacterium]|jgi:polygalacturonase|nr:glycoside hydrolase family 28 protein [Prevotellaceae bacterium]
MKKNIFIVALAALCSLNAWSNKAQTTDNWKEMDSVLAQIKEPKFPDKKFHISAFGAYDGVENYKINAINRAIEACHLEGGGTVIVPKGVFYTPAITLKSNVNLHLEEGAVLKFSTNPDDYLPMVRTAWEGWDCINYRPLIYAFNETNVAITGKGTLDGQATSSNWWPWKGKKEYGYEQGTISQEWNGTKENGGRNRLAKMEEDNVPLEQRVMKPEDKLRPSFVEPQNCVNVLLEDFTLINSPFWCLHPFICENVIVRGVTVNSHGPNNDGCDPESCKNVLIENCKFDTGDDCIAIKSGKNNDGRKRGMPSENIIVRHCEMKDGHGGVVLGSEISGNVRNVWVENCVMDSPNLDRVIRIKSNPVRGGILENFFIRNIKVGECKIAIFGAEMKYEKVTTGENMPIARNFVFENITSKSSNYGVFIDGIPNVSEQVMDISFKNCEFDGVKKASYQMTGVKNISFDNVKINGELIDYSEK